MTSDNDVSKSAVIDEIIDMIIDVSTNPLKYALTGPVILTIYALTGPVILSIYALTEPVILTTYALNGL